MTASSGMVSALQAPPSPAQSVPPSAESFRPSLLDAPPAPSRGASAIAGAGAAAAHVVVVLLALAGAGIAREVQASLAVTEMVDVELPPAAPEVAEKPPEPEPPPTPVPARAQPKEAKPEEPTPAAAVAGQVLAAADEALDFGDTFVAGTGDSYAGGVTERVGTSTRAVRDVNARAGGVAPAVSAAPARDLSRAPRLAGGMEWDCPFPPEADDASVDHAVVTLRVDVSATGQVRAVQATADPGYGFAREARRCAMSKRWSVGLDRDGHSVDAIALVNVRFDRQ